MKYPRQSLIVQQGVYTNAAVQLGNVVLNSRAFWIWSTILTIILVILWLTISAATAVGLFTGKLVELDRGWRANYYESSAENEKHEQESAQQNGN